MPWSVSQIRPCVINGDEGEWLATCADAKIAAAIVADHNIQRDEPPNVGLYAEANCLSSPRKEYINGNWSNRL